MTLSEKEIQKQIDKIGEKIVSLRLEKGLKQFELADKLNISESSLLRIEKGRTNPTYRTLALIANALDLSLIELINIETNQK